ncbi:MAG: hypothetical protein OEZ01_00140 [Candidatus Heimdallarchaeota archaeon]|nr:hypothetical protein [Candidatus Heimdallarchaeota archaeon]
MNNNSPESNVKAIVFGAIDHYRTNLKKDNERRKDTINKERSFQLQDQIVKDHVGVDTTAPEYESFFEDYSKGLLDNTSDEYQGVAKEHLNNWKLKVDQNNLNLNTDKIHRGKIFNFSNSLQPLEQTMNSHALESDLPLLNSTIGTYKERLESGVENRYISPEVASNLLKAQKTKHFNTLSNNIINSNPGLTWDEYESKVKKLDHFDFEGSENDKEFLAGLKNQFELTKQARSLSIDKEKELEIKKFDKFVNEHIEDLSLNIGIDKLNSDEFKNIPQEYKDRALELSREYTLYSPIDRKKTLANTTDETKRSQYQWIENQMQSKGSIEFLEKQGFIAQLQPLNINDPNSIEERNGVVEFGKSIYGKNDLNYFTDNEMKTVDNIYKKGDLASKLSLVRVLSRNSNAKNQVSNTFGLEGMGYIAGVLEHDKLLGSNDETVASNILEGEQILKNKDSGIKVPPLFDRTIRNKYIGTLNTTLGGKKYQDTMVSGVKSLYGYLANNDHDLNILLLQGDDENNKRDIKERQNLLMKQAFDTLNKGTAVITKDIGSNYTSAVQSSSVEMPVKGMTGDELNEFFNTLKEGDIDGGFDGISGADTVEMIKKQYLPVSIGGGKYIFRDKNAGFAFGSDKKPFVLDFYDVVRRRKG